MLESRRMTEPEQAMAKSRKGNKTERRNGNSSRQYNFTPRFTVTFVVCCIALFLAALLPDTLFEPLCRHTATMAASLLGLFGLQPVPDGITLTQDGFKVMIIPECSAFYMLLLFTSFVVAYPASLRRKLTGLALGIPLLHVGNIFRVALVFAIGVKNQRLFEFAHVYLGQVLSVLFVIAVSLIWASWTQGDLRKEKLTAFVIRFVAFSSIPFLAWLMFNREYVMLTDHLVRWLFSLFDVRLYIPYQHIMYYQTFNLVTFAGLILASRVRMKPRNIRLITAGIASIVVMHIMVRICNVLVTAFQNETAARLSLMVCIAGQYLLPTLFWMLMVRDDSGLRKERTVN
jgi:exosortase H (IPTLxxWG-CTERM-specific)